MFRIGVLLVILGFGSLLLRSIGRQFYLMMLFDSAQPAAGIIVGVIGVVLIVASLTMARRKDRFEADTGKWFAQQQEMKQQQNNQATGYQNGNNRVEPGWSANQPAAPAPSPVAVPMNANENLIFQQAVGLAQGGRTGEAYSQLQNLLRSHPNDVNLMLWTAFTSPYREQSGQLISAAASLEPHNPAVAQAQDWLRQLPVNNWQA